MTSKKLVRIYLISLGLYLPILLLYVIDALGPVIIAVPTFPATFNGITLEANEYAEYPIILYKETAYFPMTYNNAAMLNLITSWSKQRGLVIERGDPSQPKTFNYDESRKKKNRGSGIAFLATYDVSVNGKAIDNNCEDYPLLTFRDVTYFPLVSKFIRDEFGWEYSFHEREGVKIVTDNYFYTAPGYFRIISPDTLFSLRETHYIKGNVSVHLNVRFNLPMVDLPGNLCIVKDGKDLYPPNYFGYHPDNPAGGPGFTIYDDYIIIDQYEKGEKPRTVKVSLFTGEVFPLDSEARGERME